MREQTAQDLSRPNNPDVVAPDADASARIRVARRAVHLGLETTAREEAQLIKLSSHETSSQLGAHAILRERTDTLAEADA